MDLVAAARTVAEGKLARPMPRRWRHVQAVAARAAQIVGVVAEPERPALMAAAWLHDIGYSPELDMTGFHPLDGALWLREQAFPERIAALVAFHSCAIFEAEERALADQLTAEFVDEASPVRDALWYADLTIGPDGQRFTVSERLAEIRSRYGSDHLVTRVWARAEPTALTVARQVEDRLTVAGQPM